MEGNNNNLVDLCDCGCDIEFDEDMPGFSFKILNEQGNMLRGYNEFKMAHESWVNYIPNGQIPNGQIPNGQIPNGQIPNGQIPNGLLWGNFKNSIVEFYLKNPKNKVWFHLYTNLCKVENSNVHTNSRIVFDHIQ